MHCPWRSQFRGSQSWGPVRDIFVSNFSAFLSEALLGLFCKHFFSHFSLSDQSAERSKLQKSAEMRKIGSTEKNPQMRKNPQNPHPWSTINSRRLKHLKNVSLYFYSIFCLEVGLVHVSIICVRVSHKCHITHLYCFSLCRPQMNPSSVVYE